jgi:acyl carrier protein
MTNKKPEIEEVIKKHLADNLGISAEDISGDDDLKEDLHMNPGELSDFIQSLKNIGYSVDLSNIATIETVTELIEIISEEEEF